MDNNKVSKSGLPKKTDTTGFLGLNNSDIIQALAGGFLNRQGQQTNPFDIRNFGNSLLNQAIEKFTNKPAMPKSQVDDMGAMQDLNTNMIERTSLPQSQASMYSTLPYVSNGGQNAFGTDKWTSGYF